MSFQEADIFTVSRLNNTVKELLEESFTSIWVEGEISNFAAPSSGHWYFSMKDANAQVRCAMFRGNQRRLGFVPKDGLHVLIKARVSLYPNRGEYQLIAEHMEERGEGRLQRAFELLKKKLEAAGLFAEEHKKSFPLFPTTIGVITSPTGAAIRDILNVLKRRFPSALVIIYPTLVQGDTAAPAIVKAIETANRRKECDVIILARGGGSLEDLWPFNEEMVAQAIFKSELPIISGVGHEVDFTIADFVADMRAPTPSAAAELITPDRAELLQNLQQQQQQLIRMMRTKLHHSNQHITWIEKHLQQQHPKRRLAEQMQRLDFCEMTLVQLQNQLLAKLSGRVNTIDAQLQKHNPLHYIHQTHSRLLLNQQQFNATIQKNIAHRKTLLANAAATLDALSPLATLQRGYAIATTQDKKVLRNTSNLKVGDDIQVRLMEGSLACQIKEIK